MHSAEGNTGMGSVILSTFFADTLNLLYTVFSLNFCSAGKGPFIGGKAKKNVCQKRTFLGKGGSGVGDVALTLL